MEFFALLPVQCDAVLGALRGGSPSGRSFHALFECFDHATEYAAVEKRSPKRVQIDPHDFSIFVDGVAPPIAELHAKDIHVEYRQVRPVEVLGEISNASQFPASENVKSFGPESF